MKLNDKQRKQSCKGCMYFHPTYWLGPICNKDTYIIEKYDDLRGEIVKKSVGSIFARDARAVNGQCGPDKKLYITHWQDIKENWRHYSFAVGCLIFMVSAIGGFTLLLCRIIL